MGYIIDQLRNPDIGHLQKTLTLEQIINEAPIIHKTHVSKDMPPLGRLGQLDNQHKNQGLHALISVAKSISKQIFNGMNFLYLKLKN